MAEISGIVRKFESWIKKDNSNVSNPSKDILNALLNGSLNKAKDIASEWKMRVLRADAVFDKNNSIDETGDVRSYVDLLDEVLAL